MAYETLLVETQGKVGIIRLHRPDALNALNNQLIKELGKAMDSMEENKNIAAIVLTGSDRAFAAGADILEMKDKSYMDCYMEDFITKGWEHISKIRKPIIAAVSGFALGGGCEIAMMCDIIIADETAKFGQPEITLGIIPGAGGTQRLTRIVGKYKAMEMILTGRMIDAKEAERAGLVSRVVVNKSSLVDEAIKSAKTIAKMSQPTVLMAKECINQAYETTLSAGIKFERRLFHSTFATNDQTEGMTAFSEKRKPAFKNS